MTSDAFFTTGETVLGISATHYTPYSTELFNYGDRLFTIGNGVTSANPSNALTILKNANTTIGGSLTLNGNGTNASYTFPIDRGTNSQVLTTDGSGGTSWTAPSSGTITGVTGTAPIASSGGTAPVISISAATTSAAGSMSAADKTKLDGIANNANNYVHPSGDGNLHVPATSTTNSGKVLTAGATAGSLSWTSIPAAPVTSVAGKTGAVTLVNSDVGLGNVENTALSTWAGSSSITTLGTIATGTWNGTTISLAKGGTGATTKTAAFDALSPMTTAGDLVYGGTNGTGTRLSKGTANQVLTMNSGATAPQWSTPTTGTVTGVNGTSPIVSSGGNAPVISISAATTSVAGSMSAADKTKLDAQTTGTVAGQMQYWNGTAWVTVAAGTYGQVLEFRNGAPTWVDKNINNLIIGDVYKGGIIAYFLQSGDPGYDANVRHGIIAATSDQITGIQWYNGSYTTTGATATAIGTGNANTNLIVTNQGAGSYAAKLCSDLVLNGYSDWYLPSTGELHKLFVNKASIGGFANYFYWSSSETSFFFVSAEMLFDLGSNMKVCILTILLSRRYLSLTSLTFASSAV